MEEYKELRDDQWGILKNKNYFFRHLARARYDTIVRCLEKINPVSCLDAGCGDGVLEYCISNRMPGLKKTGFDISRPNITEAVRMNPAGTFIQADGRHIPFGDSVFDAVVCSEMLEHLEEYAECLDELSRVTKQYLIITTPNAYSWKIIKFFLKYPGRGIRELYRGFKRGYYDDSYYEKAHLHRYFCAGYLKKMLIARGFSIESEGVTSVWDSVFRHLPRFLHGFLVRADRVFAPRSRFGYCLYIVAKKTA